MQTGRPVGGLPSPGAVAAGAVLLVLLLLGACGGDQAQPSPEYNPVQAAPTAAPTLPPEHTPSPPPVPPTAEPTEPPTPTETPTPTPKPTPTSDLSPTITLASAQAATTTGVTPAAAPLPTSTLYPTPTPRKTSPSPPVFGPRPTPTPRSPLADLHSGERLERQNPSAAAIKALPWVADGIEQPETAAVQELLYLADHPAVLRSLIGRPWVENGINQLELAVVERIRGIADHKAQLALRICELSWIADGITQPEPAAIEGIYVIVSSSVELAEQVINSPWVGDDVTHIESDTLDSLRTIASSDLGLAEAIIALPWIADGVTQFEAEVVRNFDYISRHDVGLAGQVIGLAWLADGITQTELSFTSDFTYITGYDVALAERVITLGWLADGLADGERTIIDNLYSIARGDAALAMRIAKKPWLEEDIGRDAVSVVTNMDYIAYQDMELAGWIVDMPFLATLEPPDAAAVNALARLAWNDAGALQEVLQHPTLRDGISDEWAPIVAMLYDVNQAAPSFLETLLDPAQVTLEGRSVTLTHSGAVDLVIIRTGPGARRSMDLLEHGVRSADEFMGEPLPINYVGLLFGTAVLGYAAGTMYETHIVVLPEYDVDDGSEATNAAGRLIAHEVAHYYWHRNPNWLDEGLAELMAAISENARTGAAVDIAYDYCSAGDNIALLERLDAGGVIYDYDCNYALGGQFFLDLYRTLGDRAFREGVRRLYLMSQVEDDADSYDGTKVGIRHIEDAFQPDYALADAVIDRWYHGVAP